MSNDYGNIPLPSGWDMGKDYDGKTFYIDHSSNTTTWIDPRDRYTKPQSFADCQGDELPYGWEEAIAKDIGSYYINHTSKHNQIEDPRLQWRDQQESMLKEYMVTAEEDLAAKKEIYCIKQKRLGLAQDEYQHLHDNLYVGWKASKTSLNSNSSVSSTKHDPDLLRADVALAKERVSRLRRELDQIRAEMHYKEKGVETLAHINEKMALNHEQYNVEEARAILDEIQQIQMSLFTGEKEKQGLMQSLAKMKEEFINRTMQEGSSPDVSTMSLHVERSSMASQTDLMGQYLPKNARLTELTKTRLQYEEAKRSVTNLQLQLAKIEDQMIPGQTESDKDRLLLINEKEQLLRELQVITKKGKTKVEIGCINDQVYQLRVDLNEATETSSRQIADRGPISRLLRQSPFKRLKRLAQHARDSDKRLKLQEEKRRLTQQLHEATRRITLLEAQLKSLTTSLLSVSSGSSRGSFGSLGSIGSSLSSSKGSLTSSSLSYTDIYSQSVCGASDSNLQDLHRRVEKLLQGHTVLGQPSISPIHEVTQYDDASHQHNVPRHNMNLAHFSLSSQHSLSNGSSLSSLSSPPVSPYEIGPPPSYEQHMKLKINTSSNSSNTSIDQVHSRLSELTIGGAQYTQCPRPLALLPLNDLGDLTCGANHTAINNAAKRPSIFTSSDGADVAPLSPISETSSGVCNTTTRSVSAAVSDESVAGDSGVFEASIKKSGDLDEVFDLSLECAQIKIKLKYNGVEHCLHMCVEQARNLSALAFPDNSQVIIKTSVLPPLASIQDTYTTKPSSDLNNPKFNDMFKINISENKLVAKTLTVNVWCLAADRKEELLGCAQVSLADFDPKQLVSTSRWYNVLSFKFMASDHKSGSDSSRQSMAGSGQQSDTNMPVVEENVTSLLEKSSQKLKRSSLESRDDKRLPSSPFDTTFYKAPTNPSVSTVKEESSDESTIISSQTSTLTRNQGPEDIENNFKGDVPPGFENPSSTETEDNEDENGQLVDVMYRVVPDAISDILEDDACGAEIVDSEGQELSTVTCDTGVNTDGDYRIPKKRRTSRHHKATMEARNSSLRRSQTFSPPGKPSAELREGYICKLNRSDSDSSMPLYKNAFQRNTMERRSLRWKKTPHLLSQKAKSQVEKPNKRTSIDLELDLQASAIKLQHMKDEIDRLRELKRRMEEAKAKGEELPSWFTDDEQWQKFLTDAENLIAKQEQNRYASQQDKKVEERLKKATKEIYKLRKSRKDQADILSFREKMAFFTTINLKIPIIPAESESESDTDDEKHDTLKKSPKKITQTSDDQLAD